MSTITPVKPSRYGSMPITREALDRHRPYEEEYKKGLKAVMEKKATQPERKYVCAFVPHSSAYVLLIRKKFPTWQEGKLNGIGGKIEEEDVVHSEKLGGEFTPQTMAMMREWSEETGLESSPDCWQEMVMLWGQDRDGNFWTVHFFTYTRPSDFNFMWLLRDHPVNDVGESFELVHAWTLPSKVDVIPNLRWLVPFCLYGKYLDLPVKINDIENNN